jgi:hypothetical protein
LDRPVIAQTNLQLLAQMQAQGYDESALLLAHQAYLYTTVSANGLYRGSGKPFVCHLVGVASIVSHCAASPMLISAALLHASYQERVYRDLPGGLNACRLDIEKRFGGECDRLVQGYQQLERDESNRASRRTPPEIPLDPQIELLALADQLEDLVDCGPALHGLVSDGPDIRGSAAWRLLRAEGSVPGYAERARVSGHAWLAEAFENWLARNRRCAFPHAIRTGATTSVSSFG